MSAYTDAVERNLVGLDAVSTGICPGCEQCASEHGYEDMEAFRESWHSCEVENEASFSWSSCGICGSHYGGDREVWHALDSNRELLHFDDACIDCVVYLANGDEPEQQQLMREMP